MIDIFADFNSAAALSLGLVVVAFVASTAAAVLLERDG